MSGLVKRYRAPSIEDVVGRDGDRLFVRTLSRKLVALDFRTLPPKIERSPIDFPVQVLRLDAKRWLVWCHGKPPASMYVTSNPLKLGRNAAPRWSGRGVQDISIVDGRVYAQDFDAERSPLLKWDKDTWTPVAGIPSAKDSLDYAFGTAKTGGGKDVLIWNGEGYEHVGGRLKKTFPLGAKDYEWSTVPAGPNSFYFVSKRWLWLAERGKKPRKVAGTKGAMQLAPGPEGAVIIKFGDNAKRFQVGILRNGKVTGYTSKAFGTQRDIISYAFWAAGQLILFGCDNGIVAAHL